VSYVEEGNETEIMRRNGLDRRKTDVSTQKPVKASYADIVRKAAKRIPLESERGDFVLSRNNPAVRIV
jgi:hypothetical protein